MGFFGIDPEPAKAKGSPKNVELLRRHECQACPLNNLPGLKHPKMKPTGSSKPIVYMLGEAPGADEDTLGRQFVGKSGTLLRDLVTKDWEPHLRWNNCIRTRPPDNEFNPAAMEACRPSVERDIEANKPVAIFGFGGVPLNWAINQGGISNWRGRRFPIKVLSHTCWFYPMFHPAYILRVQDQYGNDDEFVFQLDLHRAFAEVEDLPTPYVHTKEDALEGIEIVTGGEDGLDQVCQFLDYALAEPTVGLDYETNRSRPYSDGAKILTVGLSVKNNHLAFAYDHPGARWTTKQRTYLEKEFKQFLLKARGTKISHSLSFEMEWSAYMFGCEVLRPSWWDDTMSQAYILDERSWGKPGCLALEFLGVQYFGLNIKKLAPTIDRRKLEDTDVETVLTYNAVDARYHRLLYLKQHERLKEEGLLPVYNEHLRRIPTVVLTQMKGIPVHQPTVKKFEAKYSARLAAVEAEIEDLPIAEKYRKMTGTPFRPSANEDLKWALGKIIGVHVKSVDEKVIKDIDHDLPRLVLKWRKANKVLSTYIKPVMLDSPHIYPDGRAHPITSTTKTRTWRTSAEDFNYQNWPRRKEEVREVRKQIRPGSANLVIVSFDYGQIQARNVAMESKDKALVKAFWDRYDIHTDWMERIVELYPRWITEGAKAIKDKAVAKKYRDKAKNEWVFPSFFGAQPKTLAGYLNIPAHIGERLAEHFWDAFPSIHAWQKTLIADYRKLGYVTGLTGFRRRAPISDNELINAPIQADEAAIVCDAMNRLSELDYKRFQANMEIHDDLTFIIPKDKVEHHAEIIIREMLACPFKWAHIVPLTVEMSVGNDWESKKDVGVYSSDTFTGRLDSKQMNELVGSWDDGTGWASSIDYEKPTATRSDRIRTRNARDAG